MAEWNVDKLKEILCPLGLVCKSFEWQGSLEHFFEIPNTPMTEYFLVYKEATQTIIAYPYYETMQDVKQCSINEIRFDLAQYAKNYINSYKQNLQAERKASLEKDFND